MKWMRLAETHKTLEKIRRLEECAAELGITLEVGLGGQIWVLDKSNPGHMYKYMDVEHSPSGYSCEVTTIFPYGFETKLVYEKE